MNAKHATLRLYATLTGLIAAVLELAGAAIRLVTVCLTRLARAVEPVPAALAHRGVEAVGNPRAVAVTVPMGTSPTVAVEAPPATVAMTGNERLIAALSSLKFPVARVRAFAASVGARQAPLEVLVKEGIAALTSSH
jgi:hypothetical protein